MSKTERSLSDSSVDKVVQFNDEGSPTSGIPTGDGEKVFEELQIVPPTAKAIEEEKGKEEKSTFASGGEQDLTVNNLVEYEKFFKKLFLDLLEHNDDHFFKYAFKRVNDIYSTSFEIFSTNSYDFKYQQGKYLFMTPYLNEKFDCVLLLLPQDNLKLISNPDGIMNYIWIEDFFVTPTDENNFQQIALDCRYFFIEIGLNYNVVYDGTIFQEYNWNRVDSNAILSKNLNYEGKFILDSVVYTEHSSILELYIGSYADQFILNKNWDFDCNFFWYFFNGKVTFGPIPFSDLVKVNFISFSNRYTITLKQDLKIEAARRIELRLGFGFLFPEICKKLETFMCVNLRISSDLVENGIYDNIVRFNTHTVTEAKLLLLNTTNEDITLIKDTVIAQIYFDRNILACGINHLKFGNLNKIWISKFLSLYEGIEKSSNFSCWLKQWMYCDPNDMTGISWA